MDCFNDNSYLTGVVAITTVIVAFQVIGIALYHAGALHLRSSNAILVQALLNIAIGSILWYCVGYSLVYGSTQKGFIGSLEHAFFIDISPSNCTTNSTASVSSIPRVLFAAFEMMLALTGPFMVMAAWTANINTVGAVVIYILWPILVYYPLSHWIRGAGWLADMNIIDYSGSLTVHASSGASALVFTRILRPCVPDAVNTKHHSSIHHMTVLHHVMLVGGALIAMISWYSFNLTSHLLSSPSRLSGLSIVNIQLSSSASLLCWLIVFAIGSRGSAYTDVMAGIIAGIVGASAAPASMQAWASLLTGLISGLASSLAQYFARTRGQYWTNGGPVDVTYIHGIPGVFAALAAGLFTNQSLDAHGRRGAFYSDVRQLGVQFLGAVIAVIWSAVWTYLLSWFIHLTVGFDLSFPEGPDIGAKHLTSRTHHSSHKIAMREKLFAAASMGDIKELEDLATKQDVSFGVQDFDKKTALLLASSRGHLQCVKFLLRQPGVDIHAKDRWGATPLTEAIKYLHDRVVQCLIRHGANWTEDGAGDILCSAVASGDMEEVSRLINLGVDVNAANSDGSCAINIAATIGSRGIVQYLIDNTADINSVDSWGNTPLNYADMHEHRPVSQLLEGLGARRSSRHYSTHEICEVASAGNLQMLRHMVHNGACVSYKDSNRRTPLHVACVEGHLDVVKFLLLQPGIDVNARDRNNFTPLLDAIVHEHHAVAEYLKSHGGTVEESVLVSMVTEHARTGDVRALKRMLRWSGHVNVCDYDGMTSLHVAAAYGRVKAVCMLLKEGADASLLNRLNQTPLQLSEEVLNSAESKEVTSCYQNKLKIRRRKHKTEPSTYHYTRRGSWSDHTDNSAEARKQQEQSSISTDNMSREILPLGGIQSETRTVSRPPFLRVTPISQLSPTTREMAGGQPDYV